MKRDDFIEKYGDLEVTFYSYFKFTFSFKGKTPNGNEIYVNVGGDSDDIYRLNVVVDKPITIKNLQPDRGGVFDGEYLIDRF